MALIASLTACQSQGQQPSQTAAVDTAAVVAALDSLWVQYEEAVATGDFETMADLSTDDAVMVGPSAPEWDAMRAASEGSWPPGASIDITPIEVRVLSEDWTYEFGTSTAAYTPEGTGEEQTLRDTYLVLFRNTADGRKLYREVASPDLPPNAGPGQ